MLKHHGTRKTLDVGLGHTQDRVRGSFGPVKAVQPSGGPQGSDGHHRFLSLTGVSSLLCKREIRLMWLPTTALKSKFIDIAMGKRQ